MDANTIVEKLAKTNLFMGVEERELNQLFLPECGWLKTYDKSEVLINEGQDIRALGMILEGEVDVIRIFSDGVEQHVHSLRESSIIGMDSISQYGYNSLFFYMSHGKVSVFYIPLDYIFKAGPIKESIRLKMLYNIISVLSHENVRQYQKLDILSTNNLRERILIYLTYQKKKYRSNSFTIPFNREQMASYLCVNRSALSRELGKMEEEGILAYHRNRFTIL